MEEVNKKKNTHKPQTLSNTGLTVHSLYKEKKKRGDTE